MIVFSQRESACQLHGNERTFLMQYDSSERCRFCCRSLLIVAANSDSVVLTRSAEAGDDGAAEARSGAAFLRVRAGRGRTARPPGTRDRRRARSVLGPR